MTHPNPTPEWMEFVNFDGRITGQTARILKMSADFMGLTPTELLDQILTAALTEKLSPATINSNDVKVEPMTINAGNGGFHIVTVVADGYGSLIAEDSNGAEKARVAIAEDPEDADPADDLVQLMQAFHAASVAEHGDGS